MSESIFLRSSLSLPQDFLELKHALMYPPGIDINNHKALVIFHIFIRLSAKSSALNLITLSN